jgi:hypothetical protein
MRFSRPWRRWCGAITVAAGLCSAPAFAQHAEANVLFDEGRAAMGRRDYLQAIAKLEQSQQLDPAVGTLLNLAECYGLLGRSASAWSAYRDATSLAATTKQLERERYAARKAQELEPTLSHLVVVVRADARIVGLSLTRNGVPLPEGLWGASVPVDPGAQHIEAKAPGYQVWKFDVDVAESGATAQIDVPVLTPDAPAAAPSGAAPVTAPAAPPATAPRPAPVRDEGASAASEGSLQPTLGWIGVAAGAVSLGAGAFVYADGRSKISDANCPDQICVRGVGDKSLHDAGRAHEQLGVGLGIAGLAVAGMGVALLMLAPAKSSATSLHLQLRLAASGLDLRGRF